MSKKANIERGNESAKRRQSPAVVAVALRDLDRARSDAIEFIDLAQRIEEAVESHRHRAFERRIRITCCVLDDLDVLGSEREIATRLHTMLAAAIDNAIPATCMECNAVAERRGVVVRVRFLRPAMSAQGDSEEIAGGEIVACWPKIEDL